MKIHNGILLFIIEMLRNFLELSASYNPYGGGSSLSGYIEQTHRPRKPPQRGLVPLGRPRSPELVMRYLNREIRVPIKYARNDENGVPVPKKCILDGEPHYGIPEENYKRKHDLYTFALYGMVDGYEIRCVIYVRQDPQEDAEVLGAKLPPSSNKHDLSGIPRLLNPNRSTWFISYATVEFVVRQEQLTIEGGVTTEVITDIGLLHFDNNHPTYEEILHGPVDTFEAYVGGLHFLAFLKNGHSFGAMLPPYWWTEGVRERVLNLPRNRAATMRKYLGLIRWPAVQQISTRENRKH